MSTHHAPPVADDLRGLIEHALRAAPPERPAVLDGEHGMSYRQLRSRSAGLAHALAQGGGPVALALPRGGAAVAAMVACIRAERPFLPIAPQPDGPARALLAQAGATAVVTADGDGAGWPGLTSLRLPPADPAGAAGADEGPGDEADWPGRAGPRADALGYLLTTSGSTGQPKLVRGSARALARYLGWQRAELGLRGEDVLSNTADPWFDFSFKETLGALAAGATIAVAGPAALAGGTALLGWLAAVRPTVVCLLPSRLGALVGALERLGPGAPAGLAATARLRLLLISGEPFPAPLFARWRALVPGPTVLNLYGPTESTVIKLRHVLPPGAVVRGATVPVGRPIPGTTVALLGPSGDGPDGGEAGELCLVSDDLALGYAGPPAGATRFDRSPDGRPRLRTGDLARLGADGSLELVGRADQVVKRRGVKVSLAAIETAALLVPQVDAAAAVTCAPDPRRPQPDDAIVLFCGVPGGADAALLRRIRAGLLERLEPAQMPDHIVVRAELPLDGRAKLDRAALRALAARDRSASGPR